MKIFFQKSFKSRVLTASAVLFFSASAVQASTACYDYCWNQAQQAATAAAQAVVSERAPICSRMTIASERNACFADMQQRANGAYGQTINSTMTACMNNTQCRY